MHKRILLGLFVVVFSSNLLAEIREVVIVGAGLAGLSAADRLSELEIKDVYMYEARERTGGRVWTEKYENTALELGAAFINSDHHAIRELAKKYKVPLTRIKKEGWPPSPVFQFVENNASMSNKNFERFSDVAKKMFADQEAILKGDKATKERLRNQSMKKYLDSLSANSELIGLMRVVMQSEYGLELDVLQALSIFDVTKIDLKNKNFDLTGNLGDEAWFIAGGSSALVNALTKKATILYEYELIDIKKIDDHYALEFHAPGKEQRIVHARRVIDTTPLPQMAKRPYTKTLPPYLVTFINARPMGNNSKYFFIFDKPFWKKENAFFSLNNDLLSIWDNCESEFSRTPYSLTGFAGGLAASTLAKQSNQEIIDATLTSLEAFFPEARSHFIRMERGKEWMKDRFTHGSYTGAYRVGEATQYEATKSPYFEGMFFAGSSWADGESEGFMNGAVKTGRRAAELLLADSQKEIAKKQTKNKTRQTEIVVH